MEQTTTFRIQAEAAEALAHWKAAFAEQVISQARELAREGNSQGVITISHYRQATMSALHTLVNLVQETPPIDGHQEAA